MHLPSIATLWAGPRLHAHGRCAECTWAPVYDKHEQFDKIVAGLLQGEVVEAVYDAIGAGTGFIGLTNKRVTIQDNSSSARRWR